MENIRITSGIYRGQSILSPKSEKTHPMGSREKLALFNMISDYLDGAEVLDAFAGSGALGIEAISRGAGSVDFIEKSPKVAQTIAKNLTVLGTSAAKVNIVDAGKFVTKKMYDVIIADPPYDNFDIDSVVYLTKYLKADGILVLSHPGITPEIDGLKLTKSRKYAGAVISIYQKHA